MERLAYNQPVPQLDTRRDAINPKPGIAGGQPKRGDV